jgi:twitching motility protein PilT
MAVGNVALIELLKRAVSVGAGEVKLIPGRRTIVVLPQGESEVRGDTLTAERVEELMNGVITPAARRSLASGAAEWDFELEGRGLVRARADLKGGAVHLAVLLDRRDAAPARPMQFPEQVFRSPVATPAAAAAAAAAAPAPAQAGHAASQIAGSSPVAAVPMPPPAPSTAVESPPINSDPRAFDPALANGTTAEIDRLLLNMLERKASDLHLATTSPPMLRVDGEMVPISGEREFDRESIQRVLLPIVPSRNRDEFMRTRDTDFAYELPGRARFRVNLFTDLRGMGAVFRVIPSKILSTDDLGLPKELLSLCALPKGLVLVTGPTGSGKSTTLAALIDYINRTRSAHVITIEDPVEFVHPNKKCLINQRQVGEHTESFKRALRAALREDPDIVLLGEMRDLETVSIAIETAETGHLVFGTLHTSSAPSTIDRIIDQYPPEQQNQIRVMLSSSLKGVICQMLCKKIGGGRVAALEVMFSLPSIANLIRESKIFQIPSIMQTGRKQGMRLLNDSLLQLAKDGIVTPEEALSKSYDRSTLTTLLQQHNIPIPALAV